MCIRDRLGGGDRGLVDVDRVESLLEIPGPRSDLARSSQAPAHTAVDHLGHDLIQAPRRRYHWTVTQPQTAPNDGSPAVPATAADTQTFLIERSGRSFAPIPKAFIQNPDPKAKPDRRAPLADFVRRGDKRALLAVLIPMVHRAPVAAGVLVTAVVAVATVHFPMRLGLLVAVVAGVLVAVGAEALRPEGQPHGVEAVAADITHDGEVA